MSNSFNVSVKEHKNGDMQAEVTNDKILVKEIWQVFTLNKKVTLHLLKKQVELEAWSNII